eukprot:751570-Hanusia_phi.AAC.3
MEQGGRTPTERFLEEGKELLLLDFAAQPLVEGAGSGEGQDKGGGKEGSPGWNADLSLMVFSDGGKDR